MTLHNQSAKAITQLTAAVRIGSQGKRPLHARDQRSISSHAHCRLVR
jgi:hypothetical protein